MDRLKPVDSALSSSGQYKTQKGSIDFVSLGQNEDFVPTNFGDIANVVVGSHWTEFSNEYGSCARDIFESGQADKR